MVKTKKLFFENQEFDAKEIVVGDDEYCDYVGDFGGNLEIFYDYF